MDKKMPKNAKKRSKYSQEAIELYGTLNSEVKSKPPNQSKNVL